MKKQHLLLLLPLFYSIYANATHIRAGNITYEYKEGLTYIIVLTGYADTDSPVLFGSNGLFEFGDGTSQQINNDGSSGWIPRSRIDDGTWKYEMELEHTFPAAGTYMLSFRELYRNEGILNMNNSANTPFYVESVLVVENSIRNNSIKFREEPSHKAYLNQTYHYNPQAFDIDGDSLSYHLLVCKQAPSTAVANYRYPHQVSNGGDPLSETGETAYFTINPTTGDVIWDAPVLLGEYNIVFEVVEWRKINNRYTEIGRVSREMQLIVLDAGDTPVELNIPALNFPVASQQVQLEQGSTWELNITATAENPEDTVVLLLSGDFIGKNLEISPADSTTAKGEASISIRYTHGEEVNEQYQLIAVSYVYSSVNERRSTSRSRSVHFLSPVEETETEPEPTGIKELNRMPIGVYPNPSFSNSFFIESEFLAGKAGTISLFNVHGQLVYHKEVPAFPIKKEITSDRKLQGMHLLVIRQENKVNTFRMLFLDKE